MAIDSLESGLSVRTKLNLALDLVATAVQPATINDFTAIQEFSAGVTGGVDTNATATGTVAITLDGKCKNLTLSGALTPTFSVPSGAVWASALILVTQPASVYQITWPVGAITLGTVPTMAANKRYTFVAWTPDGGTTYFIQTGAFQA